MQYDSEPFEVPGDWGSEDWDDRESLASLAPRRVLGIAALLGVRIVEILP